jgi:hypothetical protein
MEHILCPAQAEGSLEHFGLYDVALDAMSLKRIDPRRQIFGEQLRTQKVTVTNRVDVLHAEGLAHAANRRSQIGFRAAWYHPNTSGRLERLSQMAERKVQPPDVASAWLTLADQHDLILAHPALRASSLRRDADNS